MSQIKQVYRSTATDKPENRYGICVMCGDRVYSRHDYITTKEGYCHRSCVM